MLEYRAYILDRDGHIQNFEPLSCADDAAALAAAEQLVDGHDVELWQADRMVARLACGAADQNTHDVGSAGPRS